MKKAEIKMSTKEVRVASRKMLFKEIVVALVPQSVKPLYVASFFSGVGGFDKGAKRAGFTSLVQSDWWNIAGKAFELNIPNERNPDQPNYLKSEGIFLSGSAGDITKLGFGTIQSHVSRELGIELKQGDIDVIIGGPPCQGFSKANTNKKANDYRNLLIFQLLRNIDEAKPKVAMIEQVEDLLADKFHHIWTMVKVRLNSMKDYVWDFKVLNAMHYGARQNRKRLIIMLVKRDLNVRVSFPQPTMPDLSKVSVQALLPHVHHFSPGQFLDGISPAKGKLFCTMTATGSEYLYDINGKKWNATIKERLVLTELEGLNLIGIGFTSQKKLLGNMVQVSFAEALFNHIKLHILKV